MNIIAKSVRIPNRTRRKLNRHLYRHGNPSWLKSITGMWRYQSGLQNTKGAP